MKMLRAGVLATALAGIALLLEGCFEEHAVIVQGELIPMTQQDVVNMAREGASNAKIIREIRESGTIFRLTANDVENLKKEGVPVEVIDYMLFTREISPAFVERQTLVVYDPWWAWDYPFVPGYYYYPSRLGLSFNYAHFGSRARYRGYGTHFRHWR